jgi:hypothetical protein
LFLSSNSGSTIAPKVSSIIKINVKVVHPSGTSITINTSSVDVNVWFYVETDDATADWWAEAALMVLGVRRCSAKAEFTWLSKAHAWRIEVEA